MFVTLYIEGGYNQRTIEEGYNVTIYFNYCVEIKYFCDKKIEIKN